MIDTAGGSTSAPAEGAAIPAPSAPNLLHVACPCPGAPHPYDVVTFHPEVTNELGMAVGTTMRLARGDETAMQAALGSVFLRFGIARWTFVDHNGPVEIGYPVDRALVERWLPFTHGGYEAIEVANRLYGEEVFRPFEKRLTTRSPDGAADTSTSASTNSGKTPRKRSKRSSPRTSDGRLSVVPTA